MSAFAFFIFGDWYLGLGCLLVGILMLIFCAKDKDAFK